MRMNRKHLQIMAGLLGAMILLGGRAGEGAAALSGQAEEAEPYLRAPQGPYRGRVVEVRTGRPIRGALVLAIWQEDVAGEGGPPFLPYAFRETLTDGPGRFLIDGTAIETNPPLLALPPRFIIFARGYTPFPEDATFPLGAPAAPFRGRGRVIRLRPTPDGEDRIESFNTFVAMISGFQLFGNVDALTPPLRHLENIYNQEFKYLLALEIQRAREEEKDDRP